MPLCLLLSVRCLVQTSNTKFSSWCKLAVLNSVVGPWKLVGCLKIWLLCLSPSEGRKLSHTRACKVLLSVLIASEWISSYLEFTPSTSFGPFSGVMGLLLPLLAPSPFFAASLSLLKRLTALTARNVACRSSMVKMENCEGNTSYGGTDVYNESISESRFSI